jgi:hypothetical protein
MTQKILTSSSNIQYFECLIALESLLINILKKARVLKAGPSGRTVYKAAATLEPEPTQHNSLDRLQTRE